MPHGREQIRAAFATALTGLATTGDNVFTGHPYPLAAGERPGLVVVAPVEAIDPDGDLAGSKLDRNVTLVVIGYAGGEDVEDTLDDIAAEVEAAVAASVAIAALVKYAMPTGTVVTVAGGGRQREGEIRLSFDCRYRTARSNATVIIA